MHNKALQSLTAKTVKKVHAHRPSFRALLLVQLPYELDATIDSVRGAPRGLSLEPPPPLRIPLIAQYIHADAVLHS